MLSWRTLRWCSRSGCLCHPYPCYSAARHRCHHQSLQRFYPAARPGNSFLARRTPCRKCIEGSEFLKQSPESEESEPSVIIQSSWPCTVSTLLPERCRFHFYFRGKRRTRRSTHSQLNAQELAEQEIYPGTVRLSIGTEHIDDLIADLDQALAKI